MDNEYLRKKHDAVLARFYACREEKRRIVIRQALSLLLTGAWYVVWTESALRYFRHAYATFNPKNVLMYIAVFVLIILPFFLFHPTRVFTDRTYCGIIRNIKTRSTVGTTTLLKSTRLMLYITDTNGRIHKKTIIRRTGFLDRYTVGTPVSVIRGIPYPVKLDEITGKNTVLCQYCGSFEPKHYTRCFECRHPLWNKE